MNLNEKRTDSEQTLIDNADSPFSFGEAVDAERAYQDRKWGGPPLHIHTAAEWIAVLTKEFGEAVAELFVLQWPYDRDEIVIDNVKLRARRELVQVAAVCCAILEELSPS